MGNFRAYPGRFIKAEVDQTSHVGSVIPAGTVVQVLNSRWNFTFVGIPGTFSLSGKGWSPLTEEEERRTWQSTISTK